MRRTAVITGILAVVGITAALAVPELPTGPSYAPKVAPASDEGQRAIVRMEYPSGFKVTLWAAEPMLANPIAFCFDHRGRAYVAETFRLKHGVSDNRAHMYWLNDDLASRTVADRVAMYRKHLGKKFPDWEKEHDRVKVIWDEKGTGQADRAEVFADGFNGAASGLGSGVLAFDGNIYYACIPDFWRLRDTKDTHKADVRESLSTGYGVHVAFIGHDSHGVTLGPDGRIYFSIGDRGLNVTTREGKHLNYPDTGAILRCEPDGRNLEVIAFGLRNPQELVFDDLGNLFTWDNNSDSGDKTRWLHVVHGADYGWRIGYQYGSSLYDESQQLGNRGPWNVEKLWYTRFDSQPAYVLPPISHLGNGPSGICAYPGTGLPSDYNGTIFAVDFKGSADTSLIYAVKFKPAGSTFEMAEAKPFLSKALPTDCEFGPDSSLYFTDWVNGWDCTGKGRIYRVTHEASAKSPMVAEVKSLLAEGFTQRPTEELLKLLNHQDRRVRWGAQMALATPANEAVLSKVLLGEGSLQARVQAVWALGQIARKPDCKEIPASLLTATKLDDPELRAQAARVLGDCPQATTSIESALVDMAKDTVLRVRLLALEALGKRGRSGGSEAIAALRSGRNADPHLRHVAALTLAAQANQASLQQAEEDPDPAVRMGALLAHRMQVNPAIAKFLNDEKIALVEEAARAIHDLPISAALPDLANWLQRNRDTKFAVMRALNAHFRLGQPENAAAIAAHAANSANYTTSRLFAVELLGNWAKPSRRDAITGLTQSLPVRDAEPAVEAYRNRLAGIISGRDDRYRNEAVKVAAKLGIKEVGPVLVSLVENPKAAPAARVEALRGLHSLKDSRYVSTRQAALESDEPRLRNAARALLARVDPLSAIKMLEEALEKGPIIEKQGAMAVLGNLRHPTADQIISRWLDRLLAGQVPAPMRLEVIEAASRTNEQMVAPPKALQDKVAQYQRQFPSSDPLAKWRDSLEGGDAEAGRAIFLNKAEVSCLRCHKLNGQGGEVGPDMQGIGGKQNREYLLESIVEPNKQIAKGYETLEIATTDGKLLVGILKSEDANELKLMTAEGKLLTVAKKNIEERQNGKSAMPADLVKHLSPREMRDLVEFLSSLK